MGLVTTFYVSSHIKARGGRISELVERLVRNRGTEVLEFPPESPVPVAAISTVFIFCAVVLVVSLLFWLVVMIWPESLSRLS
jgi:hypothetical protein